MCTISVIIPCYNAARRVRKVLRSIQRQTFTDYEVICVNDGSTDNTLAVLQKCHTMFSKMNIISLPENKGSYAARLEGIRHAKGDFVYMPDADDIVMPEALEKLYNRAIESDADIVNMGSYAAIPLIPKPFRFFNFDENLTLNRQQMIEGVYHSTTFNVLVWNKLYRRSLFDSLPTMPNRVFLGDDTLINLFTAMRAKKMAFISYYGYIYYLDGASNLWRAKRWDDYTDLFKNMLRYLQEIDIDPDKKAELAHLYSVSYCECFAYGVAQLLFMRSNSKKKVRRYIETQLNNPIWQEVKKLAEGSTDKYYTMVSTRDIDGLIADGRARNRRNFKDELVYHLGSLKCLW